MKRHLVVMFILGSTILFSQEPLFRAQSPVAAKIGSGGVGIDASLGNRLGADATTWILSSSFSVRYYFWERNGSPFIGLGVGKSNGGFGGGGDNTWTIGIAGWEHSYKVFLIQIGLQAPIVTQHTNGYKPFLVSLNIGARIL